MTRTGYGYFGKLFTGLFIAVGISLIGMLTSPEELDSKFALSVGAMFAAVASEYLVTASLPDSNILTMADKLHILSFLFIFLTLAPGHAGAQDFRFRPRSDRQMARSGCVFRCSRGLRRPGVGSGHLETITASRNNKTRITKFE